MQTYRRFVSYVYQYENGKKAGNRGFIKVEARGNTCSMQIALKGVCKDGNGQCRVYGFKREDGLLKGSLLTECTVKTGVVQEQLAFLRNSMGNAGYSLHELSGVIFQGDDQSMYGTQWDDEPMKMENFQPDENNAARPGSQEPVEEEMAGREEAAEPVTPEEEAPAEPFAEDESAGVGALTKTQEIIGDGVEEEEERREETVQMEVASAENAQRITGETAQEQEASAQMETEFPMGQKEDEAQDEISQPESMSQEETIQETILEIKAEPPMDTGGGVIQEKKEQTRVQMKNPEGLSSTAPNWAIQSPAASSPAEPVPMEPTPIMPNPEAGSNPAEQNPAASNSTEAPISPTGQSPASQSSTEQNPAGQNPTGQSPIGHSPIGHSPTGQTSAEQDPARLDPAERSRKVSGSEESGPAAPNAGIRVQRPADPGALPPSSDAGGGSLSGKKEAWAEDEKPEKIEEEGLPEILDTTVDLARLNLELEEEKGQAGGEEDYIKPDMEAENVPERAAAEKRRFCPFTDGVLEDCQRISLEDLMRLDPRDHGLRNNRFVQHGYQMFGHLLLAKVARNSQYILGVPGMYQQQEKFMADMFGFHNFKCARRRGSKTPCFGYWYRLIYPPKLCRRNGGQN